MDLTSIIATAITGVFGIIAIILQNKNSKIEKEVDKQNKFLEKAKEANKKLTKTGEELNRITREILVLILDTNIYILQDTTDQDLIAKMVDASNSLKSQIMMICEELEALNRESELVHEMERAFQEEVSKLKLEKK